MPAIRRVTRGQSVSSAMRAETWNAFVDTANEVLFGPRSVVNDSGRQWYSQALAVTVHNNSGSEVKQSSILALSGAALTPTDNLEAFRAHPAFTGITPATTNHGQFVVTAQGIKSGNRGLAWIAGIVTVQVEVTADNTLFKRADVTASKDYLTLLPNGSAQVLYIESGTGTKWAIVRLGCHESVREVGKTDSTITPGNAGNVSIYRSGVDTGFNVSAYLNWMDAEQVSINKEVLVEWFTGERIWRIVGAECE